MKKYQERVKPSKVFGPSPFPFEPLPAKKFPCPQCGQVGELTGKRNVEDQPILRCKGCQIEYSQHMKLGYCTRGVTKHNGHLLTVRETGEVVFVRTVPPSECRNCRLHLDKTIPCPAFKGRVGKELLMPDDWKKV